MQEVKAREIMSKAVHQVSPKLHLVDLENQLSEQRISGAPVVEGGRVIGIVSRSDIDRALSRERVKTAAAATFYQPADLAEEQIAGSSVDPTGSALESLRTLTVRDVMTQEVISVKGNDSVVEVARLMESRRIHRVLVIEGGCLLGIVSALDIARLVARWE